VARTLAHLVVRNGLYYWRAAVPRALNARLGRRELKCSLRTRDPREARLRCRELSNRFERLLGNVEHMAELNREQIDELLRAFFAEGLPKVNEEAGLLPFDRQLDLGAELELIKSTEGQLRGQAAKRQYDELTKSTARKVLADNGLKPIPEASETFAQLCEGVLRARAEHHRILAARLEGRFGDVSPKDPLFNGIVSEQLPPFPGEASAPAKKFTVRTLAAVGKEYLEVRGPDWVKKTYGDHKRVLDWFTQIVGGETSIKAITDEQAALFHDTLRRLPANLVKLIKFQGMSVTEVAKAIEPGVDTISPRTMKKYWEMNRGFLVWAEERGYIDRVGSNDGPAHPSILPFRPL
jgi:uncharacterized protein DUF6538